MQVDLSELVFQELSLHLLEAQEQSVELSQTEKDTHGILFKPVWIEDDPADDVVANPSHEKALGVLADLKKQMLSKK